MGAGPAHPQGGHLMTAPGNAGLTQIEQTCEALREEARTTLGVTGDEKTSSLRELRRRHNLPIYPLIALGLLTVADTFQVQAFQVLTPEISRSLGISIGIIAACIVLSGLAAAISPLPMAALTQNKARRALLCIVTGILWSVITLFTGF